METFTAPAGNGRTVSRRQIRASVSATSNPTVMDMICHHQVAREPDRTHRSTSKWKPKSSCRRTGCRLNPGPFAEGKNTFPNELHFYRKEVQKTWHKLSTLADPARRGAIPKSVARRMRKTSTYSICARPETWLRLQRWTRKRAASLTIAIRTC